MANEYHITAALPPNDTAELNAVNAYYISAGIIPDDKVVAGGAILPGSLGLMGVGI